MMNRPCPLLLSLSLCLSLSCFAQPAAVINNLYPSFSPSGQHIAFCSNRSGSYQIYVMASDGSAVRQLTHGNGNHYWPSWLNDSSLVFDSNVSGNQEIYRINADGSNMLQLTSDTVAFDAVANVSADGFSIVFDANRDADGLADVWIMSERGENQRRLTGGPLSQGHGSLSPDGEMLAFKEKQSEQVQEICLMQLKGQQKRLISRHGAVSQHPSWSPSGTEIVYTCNADGDFELYIVDITSGSTRKLTDNLKNDFRPVFAPDGNSILYCSNTGGAWEIYILKLSDLHTRLISPGFNKL